MFKLLDGQEIALLVVIVFCKNSQLNVYIYIYVWVN